MIPSSRLDGPADEPLDTLVLAAAPKTTVREERVPDVVVMAVRPDWTDHRDLLAAHNSHSGYRVAGELARFARLAADGDAIFPRSPAKLWRMRKRLGDTGFTSWIECACEGVGRTRQRTRCRMAGSLTPSTSGWWSNWTERELAAMRDAISAARSAWVMFPRSEREQWPPDDAAGLQGVGAIPVVPGEDHDALRAIIGRMLGANATAASPEAA